MTVNLCFLQAAVLATNPPWQPSFAHVETHSPRFATSHWLGLTLVILLHAVGLWSIPDTQSKTKISPPKIISVNWINAPANKAPTPTHLAIPKPKTPKPVKVQTKSTKPTPVAKPQTVITSQADSAAPTNIPAAEAPPTTTSAPAISSSAENPSPLADQTPLTLPHLNADYLDNPAPSYPALSRQLGEQGKLLLRVLVNTDGSVEQVDLRKSSGHDRLDSAALETVKHWRFVPAQRAARPVAAWVVVPISFSLEG